MKKKYVIIPLICIVALILFANCTYTTQENEYSVVKQFGKIVDTNNTAGLRFKVPFIQSVSYVSKATQIYDLPSS